MVVEVEIDITFSEKLHLIKLVKSESGMGLKESKDWVDNLAISKSSRLNVHDALSFENMANNIRGVSVNNRSRNRIKKIIDLGIATKEEKIEFYSHELKFLCLEKYGTNGLSNFLKDLLDKIDDQNLENVIKLVNRK